MYSIPFGAQQVIQLALKWAILFAFNLFMNSHVWTNQRGQVH